MAEWHVGGRDTACRVYQLFPPDELDEFSEEDAIWYEGEEERQFRYRKEDRRREITPVIMEIIQNDLTDMQRACIDLHFLHGKTQEEVADILGISRRAVRQHIYGIHRNGKRIGGGISKIRKVCKQRGIIFLLERGYESYEN